MIIPTFNRRNSLERAIKSIILQSYTNFEILIMDDGSTDDTAEFIQSLDDNRILYEWEENWGGPARPRNRGLKKLQEIMLLF